MVLSFSESSCYSHFLRVSTAAEIGMQVKSEVTSNDTIVSLGGQFQILDLLHKVCGVLYVMGAKMEARCFAIL